MSPDPAPAGRLPLVPVDSDDPLVAEVFDAVRAMGWPVPTLYRALGNSPAMLRAWTAFAWPLRNDASTPRALRELIIMRVAQLTDAPYEWLAHWDMAVEHDVAVEQLHDLWRWRESDAVLAARASRPRRGRRPDSRPGPGRSGRGRTWPPGSGRARSWS